MKQYLPTEPSTCLEPPTGCNMRLVLGWQPEPRKKTPFGLRSNVDQQTTKSQEQGTASNPLKRGRRGRANGYQGYRVGYAPLKDDQPFYPGARILGAPLFFCCSPSPQAQTECRETTLCRMAGPSRIDRIHALFASTQWHDAVSRKLPHLT